MAAVVTAVVAAVAVAVTVVALAVAVDAPVVAATVAVLAVAVDAPVAVAAVVTAAAVAATKLLSELGASLPVNQGPSGPFFMGWSHGSSNFGSTTLTRTTRQQLVIQRVRQHAQQLGNPAHLPRNDPITGTRRDSSKSLCRKIIDLHQKRH